MDLTKEKNKGKLIIIRYNKHPKVHYYQHNVCKYIIANWVTFYIYIIYTDITRAGKKLEMSARGHFEGSEMSSKVRDFRPKKIATKARDLRPILNPHLQYFLNPQSLILNLQS